MKLEKSFPYGKPSKKLEEAFKFLAEKNILEFDYPDYAGLPKEISWELTTDEVDYIQECIFLGKLNKE